MASLFSTMSKFEPLEITYLFKQQINLMTAQQSFFSYVRPLKSYPFLLGILPFIFLSDGKLLERDSGPALIIPLRIDQLAMIKADSSRHPQALSPHNIVNRGAGFKPTAK